MLSRLEAANLTRKSLDDSLDIMRKLSLILLASLSLLPPMWRVYSRLSLGLGRNGKLLLTVRVSRPVIPGHCSVGQS